MGSNSRTQHECTSQSYSLFLVPNVWVLPNNDKPAAAAASTGSSAAAAAAASMSFPGVPQQPLGLPPVEEVPTTFPPIGELDNSGGNTGGW